MNTLIPVDSYPSWHRPNGEGDIAMLDPRPAENSDWGSPGAATRTTPASPRG